MEKPVSCKRCMTCFATKGTLKRHLQRKHVCTPVDAEHNIEPSILIEELCFKQYNDVTYDCTYCKKKFNNRSNRWSHEQICKKKHIVESRSHDIDVDIDHLPDNIKAVMRQMIEKQHMLEQEISKLSHKDKPSTSSQVTNNIQTQNNVVIQINNMGEESLAHLTPEFLTECTLGSNNGLKNLLHQIHFSKDAPQNNNIRLKSAKQNLLEKYSEGRWMPCDKNNTLDEMIRRGYKILWKHFIQNIDEPVFREREEILQDYFTKMLSGSDNMYYQLRRDLYIMIMDNTLYVVGLD